MAETEDLRDRLRRKPIVIAPGVYDPLTAMIAEKSGFTTLYVTGGGIAYTRLGRPDIGLVSVSEVADTIALIRDRVEANLIVDADTGYGNALNVQRTVRSFERAGATAIQLEDQGFPKRCGHLDDKAVVGTEEMVGKIHAAVDARRSTRTVIVARTDAAAVEGLAAALDRAARYRDAGADMLFIEAPTGKEQLGFSLAIFPGGIVRALARTAVDYYASLAAHRSTEPFRPRMFNFVELNELLGTPDMLERGQRYAPDVNASSSKKVGVE